MSITMQRDDQRTFRPVGSGAPAPPFSGQRIASVVAPMLAVLLVAIIMPTIAAAQSDQRWATDSAPTSYADRYRADLPVGTSTRGYAAWTAPEHLWRLDRFLLTGYDGVSLELGPSVVAFGVQGRDVLWAAVIPDEPGQLSAPALEDPELVDRVWLRFHPGRVYDLVPPASVQGLARDFMSDLEVDRRLIEAERLASHNMRGSFHVGGRPAVPAENMLVLDMRSIEPQRIRRFFVLDQQRGAAMYHDAFENQVLPLEQSVATEDALQAFDQVWSAFDQQYAMFSIRPNVDWSALRESYRARMGNVRTVYEAAAVLASMLEKLNDQHATVMVDDAYVARSLRPIRMNGSWPVVNAMLPSLERAGRQLAWGRTEDGIGYIALLGLSDGGMPVAFDAVLDRLSDAWGLVIDLRFNGGGNEVLGQQIAGRFCAEDHVYSYSRYRNGPNHDDLTSPTPRTFSPRGAWQFEAPVIVLQGPQTMSSAESLLLMFDQCPQVTRLGAVSAGSSGNPRVIETNIGVRVTLPRWLDLKPDQSPLEGEGVEPDVPVDAPLEQLDQGTDPVLQAALDRLRSIDAEDRRPGRRPAENGRGGDADGSGDDGAAEAAANGGHEAESE